MVKYKIVLLGCIVIWVGITSFQVKENHYGKAIQLKKGNHWIYSSRTINTPGSFVENPDVSFWIKSDTVLKGKTYYKMENNSGYSEFLRDSSHCLINLKGYISFSATNRSDTLYSHPGDGFGYMESKEEKINVNGKEFQTIAFVVKDHSDHAILRKTWYAKNIGMIKRHTYYEHTVFILELKEFKKK